MVRKFLKFVFAFILFVIIGTHTHELGHLFVAELLGYKTTLHFASIDYDSSKLNNELDSIYIQNKIEIEAGKYFEEKELFERKLEKLNYDSFLVTLGGPLQTILTGFFGLLLISTRSKKIKKSGFSSIDWISVFLSLFWLREIYVLFHSFLYEMVFKEGNYFGGDERYISEYFGLHPSVVPIGLALIGFAVATYILFYYIPKKYQSVFIMSGCLGGIVGIAVWYFLLGPILLP
ncbi:hypothetical protein [Gillisia sp. CAL575]|uniref:hypothetical protein n=1 Tax=Gillisia sp. CAL575 TaxID=985255 RepID=UPI0003AA6BDE|nr:hypothetical protein [Gillisia sp. CAL575]